MHIMTNFIMPSNKDFVKLKNKAHSSSSVYMDDLIYNYLILQLHRRLNSMSMPFVLCPKLGPIVWTNHTKKIQFLCKTFTVSWHNFNLSLCFKA